MDYRIHNDLKPISANLKRFDMGYFFATEDFELVLEENLFDDLWTIAKELRQKSELGFVSPKINFSEHTEIFIISLDIIYRNYVNNNASFEDSLEDFCDFFEICFTYYVKKTKIDQDFSNLLSVINKFELLDFQTINNIELAIKNKTCKNTDDINDEKVLNLNESKSKKYQIFISSTFTDLKEERQAAVEVILKKGHIPAGMELFAAGDKSQWDVIKKWIDDSDIYVLILGGRYGSIDKQSGLSYTEMEYNYAKTKVKPLFALILSDQILDKKNINIIKDFDLKDPKYILFKENVKTNMCSFPNNIDQIKIEINHSLDTIIAENKKMSGWIKGTE